MTVIDLIARDLAELDDDPEAEDAIVARTGSLDAILERHVAPLLEERDEARLAAKVLWRGDPYDPSRWAELWPWLDELEDGEKEKVRQLVRSQFEGDEDPT